MLHLSKRHFSTALGSYRQLLRTANVLFSGDQANLIVAKQSIRDSFFSNRSEIDPVKISELIKAAKDANTFARANIVQGSLTDKGHYAVKIEPEHAESLNKDPTVRPATKESLVTEPDSPSICCGGKGES